MLSENDNYSSHFTASLPKWRDQACLHLYRIISFKSANYIRCTLRIEVAQVHRKELQYFPERAPSTGTPEPEVTKT